MLVIPPDVLQHILEAYRSYAQIETGRKADTETAQRFVFKIKPPVQAPDLNNKQQQQKPIGQKHKNYIGHH